MNKKQEDKIYCSLDYFDQDVSLWQLIPAGTGKGLKRLKFIVDSILNSEESQSVKPLSLMITGKQGLRTHARCFLRALGYENPYEMPLHLLESSSGEIHNFFSPMRSCDSYIISCMADIHSPSIKTIYEAMAKGVYIQYDHNRNITEIVPVFRPIIMTTHNPKNIASYFTEKIDHVIEIEDYTKQQLELIVLQRLKYCNLGYKEEKVMMLTVDYGYPKLHNIIRLLKDAITVMLAAGRTILSVDDILTVMSYS